MEPYKPRKCVNIPTKPDTIAHLLLVVLQFQAWNRFRFQILRFSQTIVIPIPILVPTGAGIDSKVELVPELEPALMNRKRSCLETYF